MTTWKLSPQYKKSAVEKMFFYKDGAIITVEQGFRWATFSVQSNERPLSDEELQNKDGYELGCIDNDESWEMWDMTDGCWLDIEIGNDKATSTDLEEFEAAWEEDSYSGVEALGWSNDDTEYYYYGPLELTNEDTGEVFQGEPDENISVGGVPHVSNTDNPVDFPVTLEQTIETLTEPKDDYSGVTEWYPKTIDPVRVGAYEVINEDSLAVWPFPYSVTLSNWNGKKWDSKVQQWRGLTEDPGA